MAAPGDSTLATLVLSKRGAQLAARVQQQLGGDVFAPARFLASAGPNARPLGPARSGLALAFAQYPHLLLIMPVGAAVRLLAPLVEDKRHDPAVVVLDEAARFAVSLLSGHLGGANDLARAVARTVGAQPVVTTAAEVLGSLALDLLGRDEGWTMEADAGLTRASAALISGESVGAWQDAGGEEWWASAPPNLRRYASLGELADAPVEARLVITDRRMEATVPGPMVLYRPKTLVVGVGCVRGASAEEIEELIRAALADAGFAFASVREVGTIDIKRDEVGITSLAKRHAWPVRYFGADELAATACPSRGSVIVERAVGTAAVCEPAALRAAGTTELVVPKVRTKRVTVAVARTTGSAHRGHLAVIGLGPGAAEELTDRARRALEAADAVVGYHGYLDLVRPWLHGVALHGSPIGEEVARCRLAIALADAGQRVALVSSGDAGVYGVAGIVFELLDREGRPAEAQQVEVIPGVSAAHVAAALLGAPLMSDYASISLSDLMTPWPVIERRLEAAAASDLVVAIYNPASVRRRLQLARAREIFIAHRPASTPVGVARNAGRPGEQVTLTTLGELDLDRVDMLTILIVGNTSTVRVGTRMTTRRGYHVEAHDLGAHPAAGNVQTERPSHVTS